MVIDETIYFDGENVKLDTPTKIIYKGFLCDSSPESVYMHYGYGLLWENLQEIKLFRNINNNYEADITFNKNDLVFFCFRDSNGSWDNNNGQNYMVEPIVENLNAMVPVTSKLDLLYPKLRKGYFIRKKIRITMYRIISFVGKLISGRIFKHESRFEL
ncbi:MAG: hypothetical protein IKR04_00690 [Clostridia bacterium]|nr:hypothetical protein [Clostridia bacterium]